MWNNGFGWKSWIQLGLLLHLHWISVSALYEDEAGQLDWHKEFIGKTKYAHVGKSASRRSQLVVSTERHVVSLIHPKDGSIVWRQVLSDQDVIHKMQSNGQGRLDQVDSFLVVATLSGSSLVHMRVWDMSKGHLIWQYPIGTLSNNTDLCILPSGASVSMLNQVVTYFNAEGDVAWQWDGNKLSRDFGFHRLACTPATIFVLGTSLTATGGKDILAVSLDVQAGETVEVLFENPSIANSDFHHNVFMSEWNGSPAVIWNGIDEGLYTIILGMDQDPVKLKTPDGFLRADPLHSESPVFKITGASDTWLAVLEPKNSQTALLLHRVTDVLVSHPVILPTQGRDVIFYSIQQEKTGSLIMVTQREIEYVTQSFTIDYDVTLLGQMEQIYLHPSLSSDTFRAFIVTQSGTSISYKGSSVVWSRSDYLAHVQSSLFIDLPEPGLLSQEHDELNESMAQSDTLSLLERLVKRYSHHIMKAQTLIPVLMNDILHIHSPKNQSQLLQRDAFGKRKLIVFVTQMGVVEALDSMNGNTVWKRFFDNAGTCVKLSVSRSTLIKYPAVLSLACVDESKNQTIVYGMDGFTGFNMPELPVAQYPFAAKKIVSIPFEIPSDRLQLLGLVSPDFKVHVYPPTLEAMQTVNEHVATIQFYDSKGQGSRGIQGYSLMPQTIQDQLYFNTWKVWSFELPKDYRIVAMASRTDTGKISSVGRVLGDRNVLYKYLNPHVLTVLAHKSVDKKSTLKLFLVDAMTGSLLHESILLGAGPLESSSSVQLLHAENWVVAVYYNHVTDAIEQIPKYAEEVGKDITGKRTKKRVQVGYREGSDTKGFEVLVLELFESSIPNIKDPSPIFSSLTAPYPHVIDQAYTFTSPVRALGVTKTAHGITTKEILFGLESGQVASLSKRMLDPRRPIGALTNEDKEEGLIPYKVHLDVNPKEVPSYHLYIPGITGIVTAASHLESTSLMCAYGLDVFFTQRTPSKAFDVLSEDFSRSGLIVTIVALIVGIFVSKSMGTRKKVQELWK